jgi:hypothetical protein
MASYYTDKGIGQTMQGRLLDSLTHSQDPSQNGSFAAAANLVSRYWLLPERCKAVY